MAAQYYEIPNAALYGIYSVEQGRIGTVSRMNDNGTYDIGPMQINSIWIPKLSEEWGVSEHEAFLMLRDDPCSNVYASGWILQDHLIREGDVMTAIGHYHSRTPALAAKYQSKVYKNLEAEGLVL